MTENLPVTDGISDDKIIPTLQPTPFAQLRLPAEKRVMIDTLYTITTFEKAETVLILLR